MTSDQFLNLAQRLDLLEQKLSRLELQTEQLLQAIATHGQQFDRAYGNMIERLHMVEALLKPDPLNHPKSQGDGSNAETELPR